MIVDLTQVVDYVGAAALATVTASIPVVLQWGAKHVAFLRDRQLSDAIAAAATRGAGLAYTLLLAAGEAAARPQVQNAAVSAGLEYVLNSFPDAITAKGVTPDHIASMVAGELGKLLAADPTVGPNVTPAAAAAAPIAAAMADPAMVTLAPAPAGGVVAGPTTGAIAAMLGMLVLVGTSLAGCSTAQVAAEEAQINTALRSPVGQLFCTVQRNGGGEMVVALLNAEATALAPGAAPIAVLATGASKQVVDNACAQAGGVAVSPPSNMIGVQQVPVTVPAGTPSAPLVPVAAVPAPIATKP
jgi:hypothetical protein